MIDGAWCCPTRAVPRRASGSSTTGRTLVLLPGPPGEMKPMFEAEVLPRLRERVGATSVVRRRVLKIASMPEGEVDQIAAPVYSRFENPKTTILGSPGQVELHLVAQARRAPRRPSATSACWRQRCARPCRIASTARTGATCRRSWSTC